jgi:outer membrane protein OmpA-like peptidoglycan-associated protein
MRCRFHIIFLSICLFILPNITIAQDNVGLPFLKIGVGARPAGMAGVFTGVGDDINTLYWNPGGLGHIRRWQWSATYTQWFADVYQASVSFVKQFRILGSRKTSLGFSCAYLGMPSWDSTGGQKSPVSAGHFVGSICLGQRIDWISRSLAIGVNVKAISSRFDSYSDVNAAADIGILIKPERFKLGSLGMGVFDYGVVSGGITFQHLGKEITFDREKSLLPRTLRIGASFRMGKYNGWSILLASDVVRVLGREWNIGVGTEVWWHDVLGGRMGYKMNREDLGDFTFGFSVRWDDVLSSLFHLPSRYGDAFELDLADVGYGEVLKQTYRGTLVHYPVAPEPFNLEEPNVVTSQVRGESSVINLNWEKAVDPDPFDEVKYIIFIDKNKRKIDQTIKWVERDMNGFLASDLRDSLLVCELVSTTTFVTSVMERGVYYWAVAAYDLGLHAQLARRGEEKIGQFIVATPDLVVREFRFHHTPWITTTSEQGKLSFVVANIGNAPSEGFRFIAEDMFYDFETDGETVVQPLLEADVLELDAGQDTTFSVLWETWNRGKHIIKWSIDPDSVVLELNRENNNRQEIVVTVPKGVVFALDSVEVMATGYDSTDIPIVPEIYFDKHSAMVEPVYYTDQCGMLSVMNTIAKRLRKNPYTILQIMGSIDELSGEHNVTLADKRSENVKSRLMTIGVPESQIHVIMDHPQKILGRRTMPVNPQDAEWVMEQNRVVSFSVLQEDEEKIFEPVQVAVDTTIRNGIVISPRVISPAQIFTWYIDGHTAPFQISDQEMANEDSLWGEIYWDATNIDKNIVPRNHWYSYSLVLTDTLGRNFSTHPDSIYVREKMTLRRREVFGAAKFAQVEPVYQFYWDRLMDVADELVVNPSMRVRFEGHACVIGPESVNTRLSRNRAKRFSMAFLERLKTAYPDNYQEVWKRIEAPVGFGEIEPLWVKIKGCGNVLLGDNNIPHGRYLNRRIMVLLYKEN